MRAIDLFAGAGGFSEGARMAGVQVVWAANHWKQAVEVHAANHPETKHSCQDLHQANWHEVPEHDLLLASPACQGHSRARGTDKPHHDACRSTAWAVVSCAEVHKPQFVIVENVQEFLKWNLFPAWELALKSLGYSVSPHEVDAADFGVPQHRKRVFVVCAKARSKVWLNLPKREYQPARKIIEASTAWRNVADKCAKTRRVVESGRAEFGHTFLFSYYGQTKTGRSLERPLGTVTTRDRWALVEGDKMRMLSVEEYRNAMGFPKAYLLPENRRTATHMLGNAVVPQVAEAIIRAAMRL